MYARACRAPSRNATTLRWDLSRSSCDPSLFQIWLHAIRFQRSIAVARTTCRHAPAISTLALINHFCQSFARCTSSTTVVSASFQSKTRLFLSFKYSKNRVGCSIFEAALDLTLTAVICELLEALMLKSVKTFSRSVVAWNAINKNLMELTSALEWITLLHPSSGQMTSSFHESCYKYLWTCEFSTADGRPKRVILVPEPRLFFVPLHDDSRVYDVFVT